MLSFEELHDAILSPALERARSYTAPVISLLGHAGSGKTVHLARIGYELSTTLGNRLCLLARKPGAPLDVRDNEIAVRHNPDSVICVMLDEAQDVMDQLFGLRSHLSSKRMPILFLCACRSYYPNTFQGHYQLHLVKLTDPEIDDLLDKLSEHNMLGVLKHLDRDEQKTRLKENDHFDRQLLVALREVTEHSVFDRIILDEYERISRSTGGKQ